MVLTMGGAACGDTTQGGEDENSGETAEPSDEPCDCDEDVESWACECYISGPNNWVHQGYYCSTESASATKCANWCQYQVVNALDWEVNGPIGCLGQSSSASCGSWDPASEVYYNSSLDLYVMEYGFVAGLVSDPDALWGCDDATVLLEAGGFQVAGASSGELLYELGLRNGDVVKSINSLDLDTYADVGQAFSELWSNGEVNYTLEIERSSTPMELDYYIAVTF